MLYICSGAVLDKIFDIEASPAMSKYVKTQAASQGLGKLHLRIQLISETRSTPASENHLEKFSCRYNALPPEVEIHSQLIPTSEYSSYFVCDCSVRSGYYNRGQINSMERVLLAPGYDELTLLIQETTGETDLEAKFSKFHSKSRRRKNNIDNSSCEEYEDVVIFSIFENERRSMMLEWGSQHLFSHERPKFSDESGKYESPYKPYGDIKMKPPKGYKWDPAYENCWLLDKDYTVTGHDGFSYGLDFMDIMVRLRKNQSRAHARGRYFVRRRKWQRIAIKLDVTAESDMDNDFDGMSQQSISSISTRQRSLNSVDDNCEGLTVSSSRPSEKDIKVSFTTDINEATAVTRLRYRIYHNQRRSITFKWEDGHLLSSDRKIFSDEKGKRDFGGPMLEDVLPPSGYRWVAGSTWVVDKQYTNTDANGWVYGMDFAAISNDFENCESQTYAGMKMVRRRRLTREMEESTETAQDMLPVSVRIGSTSTQSSSGGIRTTESTSKNGVVHADDITTSKLELFKQNYNEILRLCQERKSLDSPVCIPYEQVKSVDVVTPSILFIVATVHRYFGEDKHGNDVHIAVEVDMFVLECDAVKLCRLIKDRLTLLPLRQNMKKLVSAGTITGDVAITYSDSKCLNEDGSAVALSLGSETMQMVYAEISKAESRVVRKKGRKRRRRSTSSLIEQWTTKSNEYCTPILARLKLYAFVLLNGELTGPQFDEKVILNLVENDMQCADQLYNQLTVEQDSCGIAIMDAAKQTAQLLLDAAEMRISDYALCGWDYRSTDLFKSCITKLINGYFNNLVRQLGYFFDSKDVLKALAGNQSKLSLIEFFIEYDSHLTVVVANALRPYQLVTNPEPNLSLALSVEELMSWYVVLLRVEMMDYVNRTFQISLRGNEEDYPNYEMPWEVMQDENNRLVSVIPGDVFNLVSPRNTL